MTEFYISEKWYYLVIAAAVCYLVGCFNFAVIISQFKNRDNAMRKLRTRLYDAQRQAKDAAYSEKRKLQVGSGDRSERIRTYNYPQGRVTDHRINLTLYKLDEVVSGDALGEIIDALITEDQAQKLSELD